MKSKKSAVPSANRTGFMDKGTEAKQSMKGAQDGLPTSQGSKDAAIEVCMAYIQESESIGTMPDVANMMKSMMKTVMKRPEKLAETTGKLPKAIAQEDLVMTFLDKLGERLAFERSGVRLYEALITKASALAQAQGPGLVEEPTLEDLMHIRDEEFHHFEILQEAFLNFGADPTVETPCADVTGVASLGLFQVVSDPRTNLAQCLSAILIAELTDNDGWEMLIQIADQLGLEKEAERFREALHHEEEHLMKVRHWLSLLLTGQPPQSEAQAA